MSVSLESPAITKQKRKRRPTRTPKPSTPLSAAKRLCAPSPFLDRSFQRKKLYFGGSINNDKQQQKSIDSDQDDSEYNPDQDQSSYYDEDDEESTEYHDYSHINIDEQKQENLNNLKMQKPPKFDLSQPRSNTVDLLSDIQNLSIHTNNKKNKRLLSNKSKSESISTPKLFDDSNSTKIKKKPSVKKQQETDDKKSQKENKSQPKVTMVRITKSHRVFKKCHKFGGLLVKPLECGSGCPLYCSFWKEQHAVTKLMPLFENEEFTKEENVDNALREFEFHADIYRKGVKLYGLAQSPTCPIYACVNLKHDGECNKDDPNDKPKPYLAFVMPQYHCNLAQFVGKYRKLNDKEANDLLITGLRFLKLLEENKMVHCDIKPENIFLDVRMYDGGVRIHHFVFADFGCAALKTEEFPYGNLTGTITMWDLTALGKKYGDENGFDEKNDLYGFIGSLLDGVYGGSIMEELLEEADENWEETEWEEYGALIRNCRKEMMSDKFIERELNELKIKKGTLRTVLLQIGKKRKDRMTLKQILSLIDIESC